ncbi:vicilin-like seed storage protein At2g18540 [Harpegnathos saltator]|uniref:Golgin subfamily A member 6-like protein 22 n=1 Tax=Harpegnathos saltator TaxID=610380 RepID=E2BLH3_HARSA|nr:vicilin-like seed storage protein At2g18540 [Harpegnathos saltator]EFN83458.1 hypothetical protein EAI_06828 [Harpegnathos saltator]
MKEVLREEVRGQGEEIRRELEDLRKKMEEREVEWRREREELRERIESLEGEARRRKESETDEVGIEQKEKGTEERMKEVERRIEMREREERRRNIITRGTKRGEREIWERLRKIIRELGIEMEVKEIRKMGRGKETETERRIIRVERIKGKREIMRRRKEIMEKGIKVEDDLTWKERKMRWNLKEIAREERGKGKNVWVKYGRIQIRGKWWKWDEKEEKLRDNEEGIRTEKEEGGLWNKDKEFWERIREWDVVMMMETWLDEKGWEKLRGRLPKEFKWKAQTAERRNKKGRACGGMLMEIKKELRIVEEEE